MKHKSTPQMQELVEKIARRADVDLNKPGAYIKVRVRGYMPLVIEGLGGGEVAVGHFYVQNGDVVYDPEVVFFTGWQYLAPSIGGGWVPVSIQHPAPFGRKVYGRHDEEEITELRRGQQQMATFVNQWVRNLKMQGFRQGEIVETVQGEEIWISSKHGN